MQSGKDSLAKLKCMRGHEIRLTMEGNPYKSPPSSHFAFFNPLLRNYLHEFALKSRGYRFTGLQAFLKMENCYIQVV